MNTLQQELFAPKTQAERILARLEKAGAEGVKNYEFVGPECGLRYSARIQELREDGYKIEKVHVKGGVFKYVLHRDVAYEELPEQSHNWWSGKALSNE